MANPSVQQTQLILSSLIRMASAGLAVAAQVMYVRMLGAEAFGVYVEVVTVASIALTLFGLGADKVVVRELAPLVGTKALSDTLKQLLAFQSVAIAVGLLAVGAFMLIDSRSGMGWVLALAFTLMASQFLSAVCCAHDRHGTVDSIDLLLKPALALSIALTIHFGFVRSGQWGVVIGAVTAQALAAMVLALLAWRLTRASPGPLMRPSPAETALPPWHGRLHYLVLGAVSYTVFQLDTLVLSGTLSASQLASYGMASAITKVVSFVPTILATQRLPRLARALAQAEGGATEAARLYLATERLALAAGLIGWLLVLIFGKVALEMIDPDFGAAYPALCVLCFGHIANSLTQCLTGFLAVARHERLLVRGQVFGALVALAGYLVLIPTMGMLGAALAAATAMVLVFAFLRKASGTLRG